MTADISFYFDFNSPYAYLAAERIDGLIPDAEWKPIAFPYLLHERGRLEEAMKRDTGPIHAEVATRAAERGLPPFNPPAGWPVEIWSLAPLRAAVYAGEKGLVREFSLAAYRKVFVEGRSLAEPGNLSAAAADAGLEPDEVTEAIGRAEIKDRLKQNTSEAIAGAVEGIPSVAIDGQLYWGDDRLEEAAAAAAGS